METRREEGQQNNKQIQTKHFVAGDTIRNSRNEEYRVLGGLIEKEIRGDRLTINGIEMDFNDAMDKQFIGRVAKIERAD